jgi:hypothetical protein
MIADRNCFFISDPRPISVYLRLIMFSPKERCPADSREPARQKRYGQVSGKQGGFAKHEIVKLNDLSGGALAGK